MRDMVYVKLRSYRQKSLAKKQCEKLSPRYFSPYEVLERIEVVAYKLKSPEETSVHNVFHVSQLKKSVSNKATFQSKPPKLSNFFEWMEEPLELLVIRWRGKPIEKSG